MNPEVSREGGVSADAIKRLMSSLEVDSPFSLTPLDGGANNRLFRVTTGSRHFLLKSYFTHPDDPRNRLASEFEFSSFAWENGIRCIPKPIARASDHNLALYEFLPGRHLRPDEVDTRALGQALAFCRELNRIRSEPGAQALPEASEACFTIAEHVNTVDVRVEKLQDIESCSEIDDAALKFVSDLKEVWNGVNASLRRKADGLRLPMSETISADERCLSPSDFGFHNSLRCGDGELRFFDFEYAGWDDPAKMVCDFFCQPAVPVPLEHLAMVSEEVAGYANGRSRCLGRIDLLLPLYRIKWCSILLNEFVGVNRTRRKFAGEHAVSETRKAEQLRKARRLLDIVSES